VSTGEQPVGETDNSDEDNGLSPFIARILGQLSLSAWLPAGLLTLALTLLIQFRGQHVIDLSDAVNALTKDKGTLLILTLPVLITVTLITQAFSFEAIRTLEGYWYRPGPGTLARSALTRWHLRRKNRLHAKRLKASHKAFLAARDEWLAAFSSAVVNGLERYCLEQDLTASEKAAFSDRDWAILESLEWSNKCAPWHMAKIDHYTMAEQDYPDDNRIMPTRLGNIIRAAEDTLQNTDGDVQGFALRRRTYAPPRIRQQHDQFRTRLDMYSILVFVAGFLTAATPALLIGAVHDDDKVWIAWMTVGFGVLAWASYQAAIASAAGYVTALRQMDLYSTGEVGPAATPKPIANEESQS